MRIQIQRILCPVDFSDNADHAARYAVALAETYNSELILLHVIAPPIAALPGDHLVPDMMQANIESVAESSRERIEEKIGEITSKGISVTSRVINGLPFIEIIRLAKDWPADIIVMGTHGRTGLQHLLIGSVAERVVRKAPCPVLTIKHPEHEFIMP